MSEIPPIPKDLLEYLQRTYPNASPTLETPDREIWFRAGQANLVEHLRLAFEQQNETILEKT